MLKAIRRRWCVLGIAIVAGCVAGRVLYTEWNVRAQISQFKTEEGHMQAADALVQIGGPAVPSLIPLLNAEHEWLPTQTAWVLSRIGPGAGEAVPALMRRVRDHGDSYAIRALGNIGAAAKPSVPILVEALRIEPSLWIDVVWALGGIGGDDAIGALIENLSHEEPSGVRNFAAESLAQIGPTAIPALIDALHAPDAVLRTWAAEGLGLIGTDAQIAVPSLLDARNDSDIWVRMRSANALFRIDARADVAVSTLVTALQSEDARVRSFAAIYLGALGESGRPAESVLMEALQDDHPNVRCSAAGALGDIKARGAVPALVRALQDSDAEIRWAARVALKKIR